MISDRNFDRFPFVVHGPTGRVFGGSKTEKVIIDASDVYVKDKHGISTVIPLQDAIVTPGERGNGNPIQIRPGIKKQPNLLERITSRLSF